MIALEKIEKYVKENVNEIDLEIVSNKSIGGKAIFRASLDKATGGNLVTSGWEYSLEEALEELLKELDKLGDDFKLTEKLT